jgi:hypothetical protein
LEYDSLFTAKNGLNNIYRDEVIYWQQRARLQWLHQRDANTQFFHSITSSRKRANLITSLYINGVECNDPTLITAYIYSYYKNLLGSKGNTWVSFDDNIWEEHEKVLNSENSLLTAPFTEEKIKSIIYGSQQDPWLDDIPILFYQKF